jgi:hypothetical protein
MVKVPGFLRPRQEIDPEAFELAQARTAARLASIFGLPLESSGGLPQVEVPGETEGPREAERAPHPEPPVAAERAPHPEPPLAAERTPHPEPPLAAARPFDDGRVVGSTRRGPARVAGIELPANLVGVMAKPDEPRGDDRLVPWREDQPRVTPGRGPVAGEQPSDDWQVRANAYILAKAFGTLPETVPVRPAEPPVR